MQLVKYEYDVIKMHDQAVRKAQQRASEHFIGGGMKSDEHLDVIPLTSGLDYTITPHATESGMYVLNYTYTPAFSLDYLSVNFILSDLELQPEVELEPEPIKPFVPKQVWELIDLDGDE